MSAIIKDNINFKVDNSYYPEEFFYDYGNKIITRFPPEPNGYLHLGHVKAMEIDFGFVNDMNKSDINKDKNECIMRFDDTNPNVEKQEYVDHILEVLKWFNYNPVKISYTSDYFDQLYNLALKMIEQGDAYVCELKGEEISKFRSEHKESPCKDRPINESLDLFVRMNNGEFKEGSLTLRMKGDLNNPNPCMWDTILYRIFTKEHYRTGNRFCIYPTYDFSHCIVDSLENITHSFCTKEFEVRRELYYWILDKLKMKKPLVYEFSRLNIKDGILSKRNLITLVNDKTVSGWSDPRLLTIAGLRRKGYTAESLKNFCRTLGISKNDSEITYDKLENTIREELEFAVPRRCFVLEPLLVTIKNYAEADASNKCTFYDYPMYMKKIQDKNTDDLKNNYTVTRNNDLTKTIYLEKSDFRLVDDKKYFGLAPNKIVRLKYGPFIKCVEVISENGAIKELIVEIVIPENPKKIKGVLTWANSYAVPIIVRKFDKLTKIEYDGLIENHSNLESIKDFDRFQIERHGYYCVDEDSFKINKPVLNEICSLRSSL